MNDWRSSVKPGDLVTLRKWNITHRVPITYIDVYERIDGETIHGTIWKWEHGEWGILLEGRDNRQEMVQVLHGGRIGWVDEELIEVAAPGEGRDGQAVAPG
jgi:hypothetical protein